MQFLKVASLRIQEEGNTVLQDISFSLQEHRKLAIAGETGAGKSTLLQAVAGLVQPMSGKIYFNGNVVEGPHDVLVPGHEGIAYLTQQSELPQYLRVEQVLQYANALPEQEADTIYQICRISHLLKRQTHQLSGGERQRIALARLLVTWPDLLLLDEPFSSLDASHKATLKAVINDIGAELGITCILVSHDPHDTLPWADELIILKAGAVVQQGKPEDLYTKPVDTYVAGLLGDYNLMPATIVEKLGFDTEDNSKQAMVRPESVQICKAGLGLEGVIIDRKYYGNFTELMVEVNGVVLKARSIETGFSVGDKVGVHIPKKAIIYI